MEIKRIPKISAYQISPTNESHDPRHAKSNAEGRAKNKSLKPAKSFSSESDMGTEESPSPSEPGIDCQIIDSETVISLLSTQPKSKASVEPFKKRQAAAKIPTKNLPKFNKAF